MRERHLLVVEDHDELREALTACGFRALAPTSVTSVASLGAAFDWLSRRVCPSAPLVALVDLGLPDGRGEELLARLAADERATAIVTTMFGDDESVMGALAAGADGYLLKSDPAEEMEARLRGIDAGEVAISPSIARLLLRRLRSPEPAAAAELTALTGRETDVLRCIGRGLTIREAAHALGIAAHTVSTHLKSIYRKLNIASRAEAAIEASMRGLL